MVKSLAPPLAHLARCRSVLVRPPVCALCRVRCLDLMKSLPFPPSHTQETMVDSSPLEHSHSPASPAAIWAARLTKELPTLDADIDAAAAKKQHLPAGISCPASDVRLEEGVCRLVFRLEADADAAVAAAAAEGATEAAHAVDVEVRLDREETNYPFQPPVLRVLAGGARLLPRSVVRPADDEDGGARVQLPALGGEAWTPNTSILDLLTALQEALARGADGADGEGEGGYAPGQVLSTRTFVGTVLPCTVRQQGGVVLPRYIGVADDWVLQLEADRTRLEAAVVVRAERMLEVAKLRYRRGESFTVFFKGEVLRVAVRCEPSSNA